MRDCLATGLSSADFLQKLRTQPLLMMGKLDDLVNDWSPYARLVTLCSTQPKLRLAVISQGRSASAAISSERLQLPSSTLCIHCAYNAGFVV
jgi:hypothetical protein